MVESSTGNFQNSKPDDNKLKNGLNDSMKTFYRELVEITLDFMSNNMFFNNAANLQIDSMHNKSEHILEDYSSNIIGTRMDM